LGNFPVLERVWHLLDVVLIIYVVGNCGFFPQHAHPHPFFFKSHNYCHKSLGCIFSIVAGKLAIKYQELAHLLIVRTAPLIDP
jgi:hypothetical protein